MKKIPTLFVREFENHRVKGITNQLSSPDLQWVLDGEGTPTVKIDGTCCAIIDGKFYKRYDAKKGKQPPADAIPCDDPDPVTGHWPCWVPVKGDDPGSKWHTEARIISASADPVHYLEDGTYEAIGPHFQGNPYGLEHDVLERHGARVIEDLDDRSFEGIKHYLETHYIEGIVFWKDGEPKCKIKRSDFGFPWNEKGGKGK